MDNNELQHHGIIGMRWGVRRTPAQLGHRTTSRRKAFFKTKPKTKEPEKKATTSEAPKKKTAAEMDDAELRARVQRLVLEKQYRDLSPKQLTSGQKFAKFMIKNVGNDIILPAVKEAGKSYLTAELKKAIASTDDDKKK